MNKRQLNQLSKFHGKIKKSLTAIGAERDNLRNYISDIQDIIGDADQAEADLSAAHDLIEQAVETISQRL